MKCEYKCNAHVCPAPCFHQVICKDGTVLGGPINTGITDLPQHVFFPWLGPSAADPVVAQTLQLGNFVLGTVNDNSFAIGGRDSPRPAAMVCWYFHLEMLTSLCQLSTGFR